MLQRYGYVWVSYDEQGIQPESNGDWVLWKDAEARIATLETALAMLLKRYVDLINCGDCGHWDPETDLEVITARSALLRGGL